MAVVSLVERVGKTRIFHVTNVSAKNLRPILVKTASRKSYLMTDESSLYPKVGEEFSGHGTVNHSAGEYVRTGGFHDTNTVESHFALSKRGICGTFHCLSEQHLHRFFAEFAFRANARELSDAERSAALLMGAAGKRLMYDQPRQATDAETAV